MQVNSNIKWLASLLALLAITLIARVGFVITAFFSQLTPQPPLTSQVHASAAATTTTEAIDETPARRQQAPPSVDGEMLHGGVGKSAPNVLTSPSSRIVANEAPFPPNSANDGIEWHWNPLADASYTVNAREIVKRCDYKTPANDQRSQLKITISDQDGKTRVSSYQRLWQHIENGADDVAEKMLLYATSPSEAQGLAFMRWTYHAAANKPALQWLYIPSLRKTRRVAVLNAGDTFLDGDVAFADIATRQLDDDEHRFLGIHIHDDKIFYVIESSPKKPDALYSKRISWFLTADTWDQCVKHHAELYDREQKLAKQQSIVWQQVNHAWIWQSMEMKNVTSKHVTRFEITDAIVNAGITDNVFSESAMRGHVVP